MFLAARRRRIILGRSGEVHRPDIDRRPVSISRAVNGGGPYRLRRRSKVRRSRARTADQTGNRRRHTTFIASAGERGPLLDLNRRGRSVERISA